jgi:alkyldihydroxyacetonephosphate synthase
VERLGRCEKPLPYEANLHGTFLFRRSLDPQGTLWRWWLLKSSASQAIISHGGTIRHLHGVGANHAPNLASEKGINLYDTW